MLMTQWAMSGAAGQVRSIEANMTSIVGELVSSGVWTGADADRFQRDWNDLVRARLLSAASRMDGIQFEKME